MGRTEPVKKVTDGTKCTFCVQIIHILNCICSFLISCAIGRDDSQKVVEGSVVLSDRPST